MNCPEMTPLLHAYADGELDVLRSFEVEQHFKTCADCAREMTALKSLHAAFKDRDLRYAAPASLRRDIAQIARPSARSESPRLLELQRFWKWLALGAMTVAVVAILVRPTGIPQNDELTNELVSAQARSLMANHLTDVLSSDQHTVKPWFAGKLDFSPAVTDFSAQGFALVGGRLDYLESRRVAALVYRHNKHFINVFIWPTVTAEPPVKKTARGFNIISFTASGFHYSLVSDMDEAGLNQLASLLGNGK
jgi:anti-sigma factor RsiW